ncbi:MAG: hypothetical protein ACRYFY_17635, partial [Janthinobacterium lividum]
CPPVLMAMPSLAIRLAVMVIPSNRAWKGAIPGGRTCRYRFESHYVIENAACSEEHPNDGFQICVSSIKYGTLCQTAYCNGVDYLRPPLLRDFTVSFLITLRRNSNLLNNSACFIGICLLNTP